MTTDELRADLARARSAVAEAELADRPAERYLAAHLAALRVAAVVLAACAPPAQRRGRGGRPRSAWEVLAEVAPGLGEWAAYFAATQGKQQAVQAGASAIVTMREADDLVRDAQQFLGEVERRVLRGFTGVAPLAEGTSHG